MEKFENPSNESESVEKPIDSVMTAEKYAEVEHETPYVFEVAGEDAELKYFGARHSFNPEEEMFENIEEEFRTFEPDIVLVEGITDLDKRKDEVQEYLKNHAREETIREVGEAGLAVSLAAENGIDFISPEPTFQDEIWSLESSGFSRNEILAFYAYRQLGQWHRTEKETDASEYISPLLKGMEEEAKWEDYDFSYNHVLEIGKQMWGDDFNIEDEQFISDRTDPIPWEEKRETQDSINLVARASSRYRDQYMVEQIEEVLKTHKRPFVVFGSSHAVMQEPAIIKLMEKGGQNET